MSYKPVTNLTGYICLVTGASRGIGKGIALALGECGAIVYVTGRTVKSDNGQGLEDVAKEIEKRGGKCIPVACDHSDDSQVKSLFNRIKQEQKGRLDVLVNNAFAAVGYILDCSKNPRKGFWDLKSSESPEYVFDIHHKVGLRNSYICATLATQMMIECRNKNTQALPIGVIVQISSLGSVNYLFNPAYTSGKAGSDKMIVDMGIELAKDNQPIVAFSLWPGPVKTENFLEASKEDKSKFIEMYDIYGESCELSGRVISHILGQPERKIKQFNASVISTGEYGYLNSIVDIDNEYPTSMRALKMLLYFFGFKNLSKFIPKCIQIPKCFMRMRFSIY